MTLDRRALRTATLALAVSLSLSGVAQAKRWHDEGRDEDQGQQSDSQGPERGQRGGGRNDYAPPDYGDPRDEAPRGPGISLDSAVARARSEGRVLSADVVDDGGVPVYRIKVLTPGGRVRVMYIGGGR